MDTLCSYWQGELVRLRRMTYSSGVFGAMLMLGLTAEEFALLAAERCLGPLPNQIP